MSDDHRPEDHKNKLGVLQLAEMLGNVSQSIVHEVGGGETAHEGAHDHGRSLVAVTGVFHFAHPPQALFNKV